MGGFLPSAEAMPALVQMLSDQFGAGLQKPPVQLGGMPPNGGFVPPPVAPGMPPNGGFVPPQMPAPAGGGLQPFPATPPPQGGNMPPTGGFVPPPRQPQPPQGPANMQRQPQPGPSNREQRWRAEQRANRVGGGGGGA